jgi:hypothetical protein
MDWALEEKLDNVNLAFDLMEEAGLPRPVNRRVLKQQFFSGVYKEMSSLLADQ